MSHTSEDMIIDIADQWSYDNKSYTELKNQLEELVLLKGIENETEIINRTIEKACEWLMKYFVLENDGMSASECDIFLRKFRKAIEK